MADEVASKSAAVGKKRPFTVVEDTAKAEPSLPASVTLEHLYSYYGDDGLLRTWGQGVVITDPSEIADLITRKAPLKG